MEFSENKPIYLQIIDKIMDSIVAGEYTADGRLPSVRDYGAMVEVNPNTVMRAYDWLLNKEIVYNKRGIGYFVRPDALRHILKLRKKKFFAEEADYFFGRVASFGITPEELTDLYLDYLSAKGNNTADK